MRGIWLAAALQAAVIGSVSMPAAGAETAARDSTRSPDPSGSTLQFVRAGTVVRSMDRSELAKECEPRDVTIEDPYYGRTMRYRACPLARVLELGFDSSDDALRKEDFLLRARDGYVRPSTGAALLEPGGYIALADADHARGEDPGFRPIDRRQVDPGPYYMVWSEEDQRDPHEHPWPYQLVTIEIAALESQYLHVAPAGATPDSPARKGYEIFKSECIACHAINGEGGKVGPDLNVPRSIVEYRPAEQIKEYVRNPQSFRYTTMPAHPHLGDAELDQLVAYFEAMSALKHDPGKAS